MSWTCVAMIAILSPASSQCAGENVIGPFHGYCTNVFVPVEQLFQSVHTPPANPGSGLPVTSGFTPANAAPQGQASTNET
jgi:hypothetical protein